MRLLLDSDVFCKLGIGGLLHDTLAVMGAEIEECGRLPALPYMLRRGRLPSTYGVQACADLLPLAQRIKVIPAPESTWLDLLTPVTAIDPGEAQLLAAAAQGRAIVVTGDKRALRELKNIEGYPAALSGLIVVFEAILLALCERLGHAEVRRRLSALATTDKTLSVCFSAGNPDPPSALDSYFRDLATELKPLLLWKPPMGVRL